MANVLNTLIKNSALCHLKYAINPILKSPARLLYAKATLGLDSFEEQRQRTINQLSNIADKFKTKMVEYTGEESKNMIFTEDLKNMIHIADKDDVDLVIKMMNRFNTQNKELRFGNFIFGPVVMRMFHYLNKPDEGLKCFMSPQLSGFFDQLITYQILLDLLYENGRYQDMLDTFENIKERQIEGTKYPKNIVVLAMAACYKLNTKESLKTALTLWAHLHDVGHQPMRRAATFCAGLAINQGQPEPALEIVSSTKNQNYTTIRNLKVAALCELGRLEDAIPILKSVLQQELTPVKHTFNKDVVEKVRVTIEKHGMTELQAEFKRIEEQLKQNGHIADTTLDEQLCTEVATPPFLSNRNQQNQQHQFKYNRYQRYDDRQQGSYNRQYDDRRRSNQYRRPGLDEIQ